MRHNANNALDYLQEKNNVIFPEASGRNLVNKESLCQNTFAFLRFNIVKNTEQPLIEMMLYIVSVV